MSTPTRGLTEENIDVYLTKQMGQNLPGDLQMALLSGNPARLQDSIPTANIDNAPPVQNATISAAEATIVKNLLKTKKAAH